jgi:4-amino-4-deoxy-L-arabinose transferase-like glycosyltransferase
MFVRCLNCLWEKFKLPPVQVATLLSLHAVMLIWSAVVNAPTFDELRHLFSGLHHWRTGQFEANPGNPPLPNMIATLPLAWAEISIGSDPYNFVGINGEKVLPWLVIARLASVPFSLLGGYVCFLWGRRLYGHPSGILALVLWCSSPDVLAHGPLITCDMAATSIGVTAGYVYWRWLQQRTWSGAILAGLVLGIAEVSKYVWIVAIPLWFAIWLIWKAAELRSGVRNSLLKDVGQYATIMIVCLYVINTTYGFNGSFSRLESYKMSSALLSRLGPTGNGAGSTTRSALASAVGQLPVPLPLNYWGGADAVVELNEKPYGIYLHEAWKMGGWRYFYLYGLATKLSIGLWILISLTCCLPKAWRSYSGGWKNELILLLSATGIVAFVSCVTTAQFLRYILPMLPFVLIWVSKLARAFVYKDRIVSTVVALSVVLQIVSSASVFPHSISYFNELAGGPARGHNHMVDAQIDWGQDLFYLDKWCQQHPEVKGVRFAYFGPSIVGRVDHLQPTILQVDDAASGGPVPGWYAISATFLRSGYGRDFSYLLKYRPVATAGYSIYIYHLDLAEANAIRRQHGFGELDKDFQPISTKH